MASVSHQAPCVSSRVTGLTGTAHRVTNRLTATTLTSRRSGAHFAKRRSSCRVKKFCNARSNSADPLRATASNSADSLSSPASTQTTQTPPKRNLKIAVVGAGPCGLTTALALRHHGFSDVTVFDKFPEIKPALGAAFNLNGGAAVLDKLGLLSVFRESNNPMKVVLSRRVGGIGGVVGATDDPFGKEMELMRIGIPHLIKSDPVANETLVSKNDGTEMCGTVMRSALLKALAERLPTESLRLGNEVVGTQTAGVVKADDELTQAESPAATLRFADGTYSEPFDLVIGCDGVHSKIRASMFGAYTPKNAGIRIIFGCTGDDTEEGGPAAEDARPKEEHGQVHQWFGDGCYTLVYTAGGETTEKGKHKKQIKQHNVAICIADDSEFDENAGWVESGFGRETAGETAGDTSSADVKSAKARLAALNALSTYGMPGDVIAVAEKCTRFFDVGVKYHDPLSSWSDENGNLALAGDSCHAMPPFLGQGANQALQDSWVLAEQLSEIGTTHSTKKEALLKYEAIRKPPTTQIMLSSRVIGFVETGNGLVGVVRDVAFGVLGKAGIAGKIFLKNAVPVLK